MRPMQETHMAEFEPVDGGPSRLARLRRAVSTAVGACVALALLMAMGMWFYRLGVRDAENVPIIRAAAEPAKIRPEDPGGAVAPYQDVTSYRVAESSPAQATAAVIAPPPPEPRREDVAMGRLAPAPAERPRPATPAATAVAAHVAPAAEPAAASTAPASTALAAAPARPRAQPAAAAAAEPEPVSEDLVAGATGPEAALIEELVALATPAEAPAADAATPPDAIANASEYAPPISPVAPRRPANLEARMASAAQAAERSVGELARRAAQSDIQIQLVADPSEDVVRSLWQRISQANQDILHDRELAVQTTISGGTKFYRLRVGPFGGMAEARAVCQALKARGQDCIVARNG